MKLSILIASIPERDSMKIYNKLLKNCPENVEILLFLDNKKRSIGHKRQALLEIANGDYVVWVDDDDDVSEDFIEEVLKACETSPDIITYRQKCTLNGHPFEVEFRLNNPIEPAFERKGVFGNIKRPPFTCCVWRRELISDGAFPDSMYGEDFKFVEPFLEMDLKEIHIPKVLHFYHYDDNITAAK